MNAETALKLVEEMPPTHAIMLRAKHGVGKSSIVKQVAEKLGYQLVDIRLSQCEVGDIKGLPNIDTESRVTDFYKPKWWPRDPNSKGFIFLDELNRAAKDTLQAVFELCLDRRLDGESLPDGWRVISAINAEDDYDVAALDPALADRWFIIDFEPTPEEWIAYAAKQGVHSSIVDFISNNKNLLDPPVGTSQYNAGEIYPSRRSWFRLHESCQKLNLFESKDESLLLQVAKGWVGASCGAQYSNFLRNEYARLKPEDILDRWDTVKEKVERSCADVEAVATLSSSLIREIQRRQNEGKDLKNLLGDVQFENLCQFWIIVPKDVAAQMWPDILKTKVFRKRIHDFTSTDPVGIARFDSLFNSSSVSSAPPTL